MIINSQNQTGSAHVIIIVTVVVAIVGAVGFVAWKNFIVPQNVQPVAEVSQIKVDDKETACKGEGGGVEKSGVFCSEEIGIKLKVPAIFEGKFTKADNYEIFKGTVDYTTRTSAGNSNVVYSAVVDDREKYTLAIAEEPLRSGYVDVGHMLQNSYYDTETGLLSLTTSPTRNYDPASGSLVTSGEYAVAGPVPSFVVNGVKVYHGSVGDAGSRNETYFAVIDGSVIKISLKHAAYMGPTEAGPNSSNADMVFDGLDDAIKGIELIPESWLGIGR